MERGRRVWASALSAVPVGAAPIVEEHDVLQRRSRPSCSRACVTTLQVVEVFSISCRILPRASPSPPWPRGPASAWPCCGPGSSGSGSPGRSGWTAGTAATTRPRSTASPGWWPSATPAGRSRPPSPSCSRRSTPPPDEADASVFAGLRRARPDLPVHVLHRRTMLALSRAIEDESLASGERPHLFAAFQTRDGLPRPPAAVGRPDRHGRGRHRLRRLPAGPARAARCTRCPIGAGDPLAPRVVGGERRPRLGRRHGRVGAGRRSLRGGVDRGGRRRAPRHRGRSPAGRRTRPRGLALPDPPPPLVPAADPTATVRRATAITNRVIAHLD